MMVNWFRENAPLRRKLSIAFFTQSLLVGIGCLCGVLVAQGTLGPGGAMAITAIAFILSILAGLVMRELISGPFVRTVERMEELAAGDTASRIHFTAHTDCVGRMAKAMQVFRDTNLERAKLQAEAAEFQKNLDRQLRETQAAAAAAGQEQARVVEGLALALERLSKGDLLYRLTQPFSPEYEKLRADFNSAMENLQATVTSIAANTQGVRQGAGEITQASDDLSRRTEQQAASLQQTAAALDEITATVRKSAEGAAEARNVVTTAKGDAERSGEVVRETVNAMSGIETSSKQIGNIIGVIDEIAFQTNLLALNAGVEAARAGDAGRGFAVVATEVRALAQRSADAAKEIKTLISASGAQVQTGVKLVGETGKALSRIVEQVNRLNVLVSDIASSAREQATGLAEVNSAVNQMDQVTQQNAAMVEQTTAASHSLANEAEALARLVGQFQIGAALAPAAPRKPAAKKSRVPVHAPTPAGKFVALARPQPATAALDDWDEF